VVEVGGMESRGVVDVDALQVGKTRFCACRVVR